MFSFKPIYFVIFALIFNVIYADISDKRLCIDENCSELISYGKTLITYNAIAKYMLSFSRNEDVKVFSYGAGSNPDLLGVEIKGKRGYINKIHMKEKVLLKKPFILVNTNKPQDKPEVPSKSIANEINADPTQKPYEIVDGTKIPLESEISTTEEPLIINQNEGLSQESTVPLNKVSENQNNVELPPSEKQNTENDSPPKDKEPHEEEDDSEEDEDDDNEGDDEDDDEENSEKDQKQNNTISSVESVLESQPLNDNGQIESDFVFNGTEENVQSNDPVVNVDVEKADSENNQIQNMVISSQSIKNILDNATSDSSSESKVEQVVSEANVTEHIVEVDSSNEIKVEQVTSEVNVTEHIAKVDSSNEIKVEQVTREVNVIENVPEVIHISDIPDAKLNEIAEAEQNNFPTTTETPLDIESPPPPLDIEVVTVNPVEAANEQNQNQLHSNFTPEFKDVDDSSSIKANEDLNIGGLEKLSRPINNEESKENFNNLPEVPSNEPKSTIEQDTPSEDIINNQQEDSASTTETSTVQESLIEDISENIENSKTEGDDANTVAIEVDEAAVSEEVTTENVEKPLEGFLSRIVSFFTSSDQKGGITDANEKESSKIMEEMKELNPEQQDGFCDSKDNRCPKVNPSEDFTFKDCPFVEPTICQSADISVIFTDILNSDLFLYLTTTAIAVIVLTFGSIIFDKCRREGPLIARINKLEQQLLTTLKENQMLQEKVIQSDDQKTQLVVDSVPNAVVDELNQKLAEMANVKQSLEEQIQALEKELDNSTEVGIELNKIITEMLNSTDGSEILKENVEQMQKKLVEQHDVINSVNETLSVRETENHELKLELDINNKKVADLQGEVDKLIEKIVKIEEEREQQNGALEKEITVYQTRYKEALDNKQTLNSENQGLKQQLSELQRLVEIKVKEYDTLKLSLNEIKSMKNNKDALKMLLEVTEVKAQLEHVKAENFKYSDELNREREVKVAYKSKIQALLQEMNGLSEKYEKADKDKVEASTKLQVLNNYFKEKEEQMQKEINKFESLWAAKEGEATSTTERIKYMQEELQNYKAQNESLKQEIVNQEVELKSQISMLEKKAHENWVTNRQTERKLEEARQEAAQLRNRLTLRERAIAEGNNQIRMQSPLHQNGELPVSPPPLDPTQSPPPLFNPRDHLTKSPPIPGMPPFLPPPLGATPFLPPPPLEGMIPPFMPPLPPGLYPGDHRPPPLGRMSSPPPVGGRYTPESTVYSEYDRYDRRSPSPIYDSEYGASPPSLRAYSPYDDRRDYSRPQARSNGRNSKGLHSSGSENDSLGKSNKKSHRKV